MTRNQKIVVIGAGSLEFGPVSIASILDTEGLHGMEMVLVDVDAERLALVEKLANRMNHEWDAEMKIHSTTQRGDALDGAGYIVVAVAVNREVMWQRDYEIACKHGISHYAENGGPGAFAHTCRNLAILLPMIKDITERCPDAHVLNFTNPLTRLTRAFTRIGGIQTVGICHGIGHGYSILATALHDELGINLDSDPRFLWRDDRLDSFLRLQALAEEKYEIKAVGINHFTWMLSVRDRATGEEIYPYVKEKMKTLPQVFEPLTQKMFQIFGLIPVQGDTHIGEYVPYASDLRDETWERYDIQLYDFEWAGRKRQKRINQINDMINGGSLDTYRHVRSERAEIILDAMVNNRHSYEEAVNIPNKGYIANLPDDAIVEVPGMVDSDGVHGLVVGDLPEPIAALCRTQLTINELNLDAYLTGRRDLVYQMFAIDPMIQDPDVALQLVDAYIESNRDYVSVFA